MAKRSARKPWYETYFGSDYLLIDIQNNTAQEVKFLMEVLKLKRGTRLLDIGCGYGRHVIPFSERGIDVVGCDLSAFMLKETVRRIALKARGNGKRFDVLRASMKRGPKLVQCDNRRLPFHHTFDCACNMFNSFGYCKEERDNYRILESIAQALKPGGLFLIDLINRDFYLQLNSRKDWFERDNAIILEHKRFDSLQNRSEIDVTVIDKQGKRSYHHSIRLYSFTELTMLLEAAGFRVLSVYGSFTGDNFDMKQSRMLILARTFEGEVA